MAVGAARIGIGFDPPIGADSGAAFEILDQLDSRRSDPHGWNTWNGVLGTSTEPVERGVERVDFLLREASPEHGADEIEYGFTVHDVCLSASRDEGRRQ